MTLAFAPERIEHWPLARLQPYARNAKQHGPDQVAKLAASMAEFGWTVPCLVAEDGELIAGHGRVLAATQLGLTEAPVIVLSHLTEAQRRAYRIADTVWIDGIAASAASYVAMAGDEIVMPENAFLMIHDPAGLVMGTAADMRAMAKALDKVGDSLAAGYAAKSGRDPQEIAALMAAETWLDATEALALGFADRLAEPVRIAASFDIGRFRNAPPALIEAVEAEAVEAEGEDGTETVPEGHGSDGEAAASPVGPQEMAGDASADDRSDDTEGHVVSDNMPPPPHPAPPDPAAIRADAMAHARAVVDLCRLAGQPQMAGRFLETDADLDEVRAALIALRSEAEPEIAGHHPQPGRPSNTRPWGEIVARTFKLKG